MGRAISLKEFQDAFLIQVAGTVLVAAESTVSRRLGIVDAMADRLYGAQIREHCLEVVVTEILVNLDGHDGAEVASFDGAGAHNLQKKSFVVIRNA
jgi:hypothetical protein